MEIEDLRGVMIDYNAMRKLVCVRHGVLWSEWLGDKDRPAADEHGQYDMFKVLVWLGY